MSQSAVVMCDHIDILKYCNILKILQHDTATYVGYVSIFLNSVSYNLAMYIARQFVYLFYNHVMA